MVDHAHDPTLGLATLRVEAPGFQPDVQEDVDVLSDFFGQGWLFQHEHGKGIHGRLVPGVQGLKCVFVDLEDPMNQLVVVL
jgi:hypothetical protein